MDIVSSTNTVHDSEKKSSSNSFLAPHVIDEYRYRNSSSPVVNLNQSKNQSESDDDSEEFPLTPKKEIKTTRKSFTEDQLKEMELKEFRDQYEKEKNKSKIQRFSFKNSK